MNNFSKPECFSSSQYQTFIDPVGPIDLPIIMARLIGFGAGFNFIVFLLTRI